MLRRSKVILKKSSSRPDWLLIGLTLGLTVFGVLMVGNASVVEAYRDFGDKVYYLRLQSLWAGIGLMALFLTLNFHYRNWRKLALPLMVLALISLIFLFFTGLGVQALGAKRWLRLGNFRFQPSELAKFAFILWSAAFLSQKKKTGPFLILLALLVFLIMLQPDLGTTLILVLNGLIIWFAAGVAIWQIGLVGILGVLLGAGLIFSSSYRKERLLTFLNPGRDPLGASYHIRQILIALGSGGLFGLGLGQSRQKFEYLPEAATDSIFAVIAEEIGFIGASVLILIYLILIWRGLRITQQAPDNFSRLLAVGITAWIGIQALVNLAAMVALVPLTGVPLPFISYGGSSLVLALTGAGILANISRYRVVKK
jgi:cell division protein FtsW